MMIGPENGHFSIPWWVCDDLTRLGSLSRKQGTMVCIYNYLWKLWVRADVAKFFLPLVQWWYFSSCLLFCYVDYVVHAHLRHFFGTISPNLTIDICWASVCTWHPYLFISSLYSLYTEVGYHAQRASSEPWPPFALCQSISPSGSPKTASKHHGLLVHVNSSEWTVAKKA